MNAASKNTYISKNMMDLYKQERAKKASQQQPSSKQFLEEQQKSEHPQQSVALKSIAEKKQKKKAVKITKESKPFLEKISDFFTFGSQPP